MQSTGQRSSNRTGGGCEQCCSRFFLNIIELSWLSKLFIVLSIIILIIYMTIDVTNALAIPLILLPPGLIIYFVYIRWLRVDDSNDDIMVRMFAAGAVPGALVVLLIELVCTIIFASICFGGQITAFLEEIEKNQGDPNYTPTFELHRGIGYYSFYFLTAFITAGMVEEIMKASLVRHTCCGCDGERACCIQRSDPNPRIQAFTTISLLLATSIGFSTTENLMYVFTGSDTSAGDTMGMVLVSKLLLALLRGTVSMPIHAICAAFTGLRLTIRDVQRRERDSVMMSHLSAAGVPQFVVLASGVTVPVASSLSSDSNQYVHPPTASAVPDWGQPAQQARMVNMPPANNIYPNAAPVQITGGTQIAVPNAIPMNNTGNNANNNTRNVKVWNWARVLWPAILIHGTFDFLLMIFGDGETIPNLGGMIVVILLCTVIILGSSLWALVSQFKSAFDKVSRGEIPEHVTCAPIWWPHCLQRCLVSLGLLQNITIYDPLETAITPNNNNFYGSGGNHDNDIHQQMLPPNMPHDAAITGASMHSNANPNPYANNTSYHASQLITYAEQIHTNRQQQQYSNTPSAGGVRVVDPITAQQILMSSSSQGIPTAIPVATRIG